MAAGHHLEAPLAEGRLHTGILGEEPRSAFEALLDEEGVGHLLLRRQKVSEAAKQDCIPLERRPRVAAVLGRLGDGKAVVFDLLPPFSESLATTEPLYACTALFAVVAWMDTLIVKKHASRSMAT